MSNRKYILKPGAHQFAPGSHPVHHNENTTDEEIEWYLQQYPHISNLLEKRPDGNAIKPVRRNCPRLLNAVKVIPENNQQINENVSATN